MKPGARGSEMAATRRGVILPLVLFTVLLLALLGAMFSFRVNADLAATQAVEYRLQTRLAAEAGVELAKVGLRSDRLNMDRWYDNPDEFHRVIVWAYGVDASVLGTNEELDEGAMAYRFSLVADDPTDDEKFIRFGITDESAKLNLNEATESQLLTLVAAAVGDDEELYPRDIVDAILDWRDSDTEARSEAGDTESEYYRSLDTPYRVKNAPFDTVEELLLVKGVTPRVLYGEDYDRNGLLTPNERDGDESFPPDNQDDVLDRGLYPYLTVHTYETNVSNDNRARIYLFEDEKTLREQLSGVFEDDPDVVDYIVQATRGAKGPSGAAGSTGSGGQAGDRRRPRRDGSSDSAGTRDRSSDPKEGARQQRKDDEPDPDENSAGSADTEEAHDEESEEDADDQGDEAADAPAQEESDDADSGSRPIVSPASLLRERSVGGELVRSPIGLEHLATLMDRTTTVEPQQREIRGLVNINTAPVPVLRCFEELTADQIGNIVSARAGLRGEEKSTTAWLVTEDVLDLDTYETIAPKITARGQQFTIEALGYADHIGTVSRIQVVVDMVGPIPQPIYYRDLSRLGGHFPIRAEDLETLRGR
ncbi:MAG: general secretion pathway protein GspK [Phycisphaerae bacterium]